MSRSHYISGLCSGVLSSTALASLWQDYMGQEAFAAYASDPANWTDASITVPIALAMLLIATMSAAVSLSPWPRQMKPFIVKTLYFKVDPETGDISRIDTQDSGEQPQENK